MSRLRLGVDLGGSKIEIIALAAGGEPCYGKRIATPQQGYEATLRAIADLVHEAEQSLGAQASVGIGTPGALSPQTGLLRNSNSVCLNGRPLKQDLQTLLARDIRLANDANCFALSEAIDGAGAGAEVVLGVILGTGTGAGVVVRGQVLTGPNAIAGEWGHNALPWPQAEELPGPRCYCAKHGCIETFLSGPGLAGDHARQGGQTLEARQIVARAAAGDAACAASLARYLSRLARSLSQVINVLDPDVIVLGGGLSQAAVLYEQIPRLWTDYVFSEQVLTRLLPPRFGDASGVRGAAWLWND